MISAIKAGRILDEDVSESLVPPPSLPAHLALSSSPKVIPAAQWPPSKPGHAPAFAKRKRKKNEEEDSNKGVAADTSSYIDLTATSPIAGTSSSQNYNKSALATQCIRPKYAEGKVVFSEEEDQEVEDQEPPQEEDVFYLRSTSEVVGIQHYNGLVGKGEMVDLVKSHFRIQYDGI